MFLARISADDDDAFTDVANFDDWWMGPPRL